MGISNADKVALGLIGTILVGGAIGLSHLEKGKQEALEGRKDYLLSGEENAVCNFRKMEKDVLPQAYLTANKKWKELLTTTTKTPADAINEVMRLPEITTLGGFDATGISMALKATEADKKITSRAQLIEKIDGQIKMWEEKLSAEKAAVEKAAAPEQAQESQPLGLKKNFSQTPEGRQIAANAMRFAFEKNFSRS